MVVFLLLVIISILLLGASRFMGVVTAIMGLVAGVLAVFFGAHWIATSTGIDTADFVMYACFAILPIAIIAGVSGAGKTSK
jgi:hypothetical protein